MNECSDFGRMGKIVVFENMGFDFIFYLCELINVWFVFKFDYLVDMLMSYFWKVCNGIVWEFWIWNMYGCFIELFYVGWMKVDLFYGFFDDFIDFDLIVMGKLLFGDDESFCD